jgi:hypothetical protein
MPRKKYKTANTTTPILTILADNEGRKNISTIQIGMNRTLYGCEKTAKARKQNCADLAKLDFGSGDNINNSDIKKIFQIENVRLVMIA